MIEAPPVEEGAFQETTEEPLALEVAVTPVGAPGEVAGTTPVIDAPGPVKFELEAVTVTVYESPLVSPVIVQVSPPLSVPVQLFPSPFAPELVTSATVAVYEVIDPPPLELGAVHDTAIDPFWFDGAVTLSGAEGAWSVVAVVETVPLERFASM